MRGAILLGLAALAAACDGGHDFDLYENDPPAFRPIRVWVESDPDLPVSEILAACEYWKPEGFLCEMAADPALADVKIHAVAGPCVEDEKGRYVLGRAHWKADIDLMMECLRRKGGDPIDADLLQAVAAHEIGHQLGMWWHIPESCDSSEPVDPEAGTICGYALMNPMVHTDIGGITVLDHEAFATRDLDHAVVRALPFECVLLSAP